MKIPVMLCLLALAACGPREAGTASEAEAEALNKAAMDLEAQAPPPPKLGETK